MVKKIDWENYKPPQRECKICNYKKGKMSKQYCLENPKNPKYKNNSDWIYDCWGFIRSNETEEEHQVRINQKWDDEDKVEFEYV